MKNFLLTLLLLLSTIAMRADIVPLPEDLEVKQTLFTFTSMADKLSELQAQAYETVAPQTPTSGIDLYILKEGEQAPKVHAWDSNGVAITSWPGVELTTVTKVVRIGSNEIKEYYKIHFDRNNLGFLVNYNGDADKTNNMTVMGPGSYFFKYVEYTGRNYNHPAQNETHYTLAPINDYYTGGTDLSQNTIYAKSNVSNIPPSLYCWSTSNKPWDQDWTHWRMDPTTLNGDSQWYKKGPFNHSEIYGIGWDGSIGQSVPMGGLIISDWKNENTKTCEITWLGGGDYFFYYYPNGASDKFEPVVMMNGRNNNFQEVTFLPNTTVTDAGGEIEISMIDENTIQFAQVAQDGFTLTISDPNGLKFQDLIVENKLRLYLGATITFGQKQPKEDTFDHHINMIVYQGDFSNSGKIDELNGERMHQAGSFSSPANQVINSIGNDYQFFGFGNENAYHKVLEVDAHEISYTFTQTNYGISDGNGGKYLEFEKFLVRDGEVPSGLVDLYGSYRGFAWTISSPMVIVRYSGSGIGGLGDNFTGEGILYCRSLETSKTYVFPQPTEEQIAKGRMYNSNTYSASELFEPKNNYDWLAIRLSPEMKKQWESMYPDPNMYLNHVIKPYTIKGYYCDFINNLNRLATAYLNPTIAAQRLPELDESEDYEDVIANGTELNNYYLFNFTRQDDVFFIPPKRNEVCNLYFVIPELSDNTLYGCKWDFVDNEGNSFELKSKVRVYNYDTDPESTQKSVAPEINTYRSMYSQYSNKDEMCQKGQTAIIRDALVQMIYHSGEKHYYWHPCSDNNPNDNPDVDYLRASSNSGHFYPEDDNDGDKLGYLLPELDYGGGGNYEDDLPEHDGKIVKYYGVFGRHRLAINPTLAARNRKNATNPYTSVNELKINPSIKEVASVEYYNLSGQRSDKPFDGFNIVVRRYTDGTMSARKIMNPTK